MGCRLTLFLILLGGTYATLSLPAIHAQLPRRLENCLPYPTLREEIKNMQKEAEEEVPHPKVRVDAVTFGGAMHLPESIRAQITGRLEQTSFDNNSAWIDALREIVRMTLEQYGYFFAKVSAQGRVLSSNRAEERVSVTLQVAEGLLYRLGEIKFAKAHVFTPWELRKLFPLQDGDVFNTDKIREGIEALTRLYDSRGYININATPDLQVDYDDQRISVLMELGEDKQFRVGSVEVLGLDREISDHALKMKPKSGDVFNPKLIEDFYNGNKSVLPVDVSPRQDTQITQDARNGTVAIVFDVRGCP